jgi:ATPase subunit of ABC transporter with duplicated ATPase domains
MAHVQQQQQPAKGKVKVRVLVESFGSPREPTARRDDVIEVDREDLIRYPGTFEDIEAVAKAQADSSPAQDPYFLAQKEALRAEREAAAAGRAIAARNEAKQINARVEAFDRESGKAK